MNNEAADRRERDRQGPAPEAPSARQVFAKPADAVVVYKRRRVAVRPEAAEAAAPENHERGPRVFQVAPAGGDAGTDGNGAAGPAVPAAAPVRRRRRRNAQHSPGEVHHIVFERPAPAAGGYHAAWQALQALDRTLEQIGTAQRFKAALDELPF